MKIDFIIPTTGARPQYLDRAVYSVHRALRPRGAHYEIIISESEGGPGTNRNLGLGRSEGEYFTYLDDDDQIVLDWYCEDLKKAIADGIDFIMWDSAHIPLDLIYHKSPPTERPGWPCARWNHIQALKDGLWDGFNQYTMGAYMLSKKLRPIRWTDEKYEDYEYNKTVVNFCLQRSLTFRTIPKIKYLYTQNPEGRNAPKE